MGEFEFPFNIRLYFFTLTFKNNSWQTVPMRINDATAQSFVWVLLKQLPF